MQLFAIIVVIFGALCIAASVVLILRPTATHAALNWFASTVRAHVIEQAARLLLGASLVLTAPAMWQPVLFLVIGWLIIVTSVALLCLPWRLHHRFARMVMPTVIRQARLYGLCVLAFGSLLLLGVLYD